MGYICRYILVFVFMLCAPVLRAQNWSSPEIEQMYKVARDYMSRGNFQQAIITYRQAIQLAPEQMILHRDLGRAYYLSGNSQQAEEILDPIIKSGEADEQTYQVMAAIQASKGEKKKARATLQKALDRFPKSGILYHDLGKLYEEQNEMVFALQTWLDGIQADPVYHVNYYEAARSYMNTDKPVWTIIYGEMFVNIEQQTPRAEETREMILNAYKKLYYTIPSGDIPKYSKSLKAETTDNFESAVRSVYMKLSPVVSDGITTENLTMLRTRFLMDWYDSYASKYPFGLFAYHDELLRNGYYDAYNELLFGKAENAQQYDAWTKFHAEAIPRFTAWQAQNKFVPSADNFYNDKKVEGIFTPAKDAGKR